MVFKLGYSHVFNMVNDSVKMFENLAGTPSLIGSLLLVSCCSYIIIKHFKKREKEVIVISRYPEGGKAKTRLIPFLGENGAAQLQVVMTEHILDMLKRHEAETKDVDITLQYAGGSHSQMKYWLDKKMQGIPCYYRPQKGNNLSDVLGSAISDSFGRGHQYVVIIGADIPGITEDVMHTAFQLLHNKETDMVLGKAEDGGYYLIGLHKSAQKYLDKLFENIEWGTSSVFKQQLTQALSFGASPEILPLVLQDVDTADDIEVFEKEICVSVNELKTTRWSIVIPVLNEEKNIADTLNHIVKSCYDVNNIQEIVISDGGSKDNTVSVVRNMLDEFPVSLQVINSKPGRGPQQIEGVEATSGDYLLFLHADTKLPKDFDKMAAMCIQTPGVVCGAFGFQFDVLQDEKLKTQESHWFLLQMYMLRFGARIRCQKKGSMVMPNMKRKDDTYRNEINKEFPYGDQGLFMSKRVYKAVGGFPPYRLMDDFILVEKLRCLGHIGIAEGDPALIAYRRWKKWGLIRMTGLSQMIIVAYKLGVHPNTLAEWYYGKKK